EIKEELDTAISVGDCIGTIEYDYPTFHLSMDCFYCTFVPGQKEFSLLEHENATWLNAETLKSVKWLPADLDILDTISALL
ncbi:MAG: 8-oxo-dGTP diphosphatase MutT, partial [Spirochaetia bacterium]|nr:8-oxo-dGTP diphosphatase MutT [Spirochaetia bacterium]